MTVSDPLAFLAVLIIYYIITTVVPLRDVPAAMSRLCSNGEIDKRKKMRSLKPSYRDQKWWRCVTKLSYCTYCCPYSNFAIFFSHTKYQVVHSKHNTVSNKTWQQQYHYFLYRISTTTTTTTT